MKNLQAKQQSMIAAENSSIESNHTHINGDAEMHRFMSRELVRTLSIRYLIIIALMVTLIIINVVEAFTYSATTERMIERAMNQHEALSHMMMEKSATEQQLLFIASLRQELSYLDLYSGRGTKNGYEIIRNKLDNYNYREQVR